MCTIIHFNNHCFFSNFNLSIWGSKLKINVSKAKFTCHPRGNDTSFFVVMGERTSAKISVFFIFCVGFI